MQTETYRPGEIPPKPSSELPKDGMIRWSKLKYFVPLGRETWRRRVMAGTAPQPIRYARNVVFYRVDEIRDWLKDPMGYRVENFKQQD